MNPRSHLVFFVLLLSFTVALALTPQALAQQAYTQPMFPIDWTSTTILVSLPANPSWAIQPIQQAMQDWNQAQSWFLESYEPGQPNAKYTLQLAQAGQNPQVIVKYVPDTGQNWGGYTYNNGRSISIVISLFYRASDLQIVAAHELGHVLGLGDSCVKGDLMRGDCNGPFVTTSYPPYPSTLNLYGVYLQAVTANQYDSQDSVSLPPQIPYSTWTPGITSIPEFPATLRILLMSALTLTIILPKRITGGARERLWR
jgi:hypothetical protein